MACYIDEEERPRLRLKVRLSSQLPLADYEYWKLYNEGLLQDQRLAHTSEVERITFGQSLPRPLVPSFDAPHLSRLGKAFKEGNMDTASAVKASEAKEDARENLQVQ